MLLGVRPGPGVKEERNDGQNAGVAPPGHGLAAPGGSSYSPTPHFHGHSPGLLYPQTKGTFQNKMILITSQ